MQAGLYRRLAGGLAVCALGANWCFVAVAQAQDRAESGSPRPSERSYVAGLEPRELNSHASELQGMIERYAADRASLFRYYSVALSPTRRAQLKQFCADWLGALAKTDFDSLSQDGRIDYILFETHLKHELRQREIEGKQYAEMEPLIPFADSMIGLEEARHAMEPVAPDKAAATLAALVKRVAETRNALEAGLKSEGKTEAAAQAAFEESVPERRPALKTTKIIANRAAGAVATLKSTLKAWFDFYNGYDPTFTWWAAEPYKEADKALEDYATFLKEKVIGIKADDKTTIIGDPVSREGLLNELASAMIPYSPEEMIAIAQKEMAWCEQEMKRASRELGYGDDWQKALEHVKQLHVEPGKQPDLIRSLAVEAIAFVEKRDLVSVPALARDTWRMEMLSPERQLLSPFFLGGEVIQVSYPTNTMTQEQKLMSMRGNNIHFARATVFHELIPGHHLQGFMAARYRPYRAIFATPFWSEGNAFYWEILLWDLGFAQSPENRIGMLFWRMHRCARVIFSLSFHLGKMTPEQCIELLIKRVGFEPENAKAEVRRSFDGSFGPIYQCAYLFGALQFYALHKELVGSGKMTNRELHDAILKENRIPVEMVRASLTKQPVVRDFHPSWRFYGPVPGAN